MENVEVFRSGTHTDNSGRTRPWTPEEVREIARRYNESQYTRLRAPATKGHPTTTGEPAYGWIKRFGTVESDDGVVILTADFEDIDDGFFEEIRKGRYVNRSLCVHPVTLEVDHLAWLGASQPSLDNMQRPMVHASATEGLVTIDIRPAAHAAGDPAPDTSTESTDMTPEQLQQLLDAINGLGTKLDDVLAAVKPGEEEGSGADEGAEFSRGLTDDERLDYERLRWGAKIAADPTLVGRVTPGNRDAVIGNLIRFSKLTDKASFSRPTADGKGTETVEGTEAEAYYESLKVLPLEFARGQVTSASTGVTASEYKLRDGLPKVKGKTTIKRA